MCGWKLRRVWNRLLVHRRAKQLGAKKLIALTTQTQGFFQSACGFVAGTLTDLPAERRKALKASGRNSQVLTFPLRRLSDSVR